MKKILKALDDFFIKVYAAVHILLVKTVLKRKYQKIYEEALNKAVRDRIEKGGVTTISITDLEKWAEQNMLNEEDQL